MKKIISFILLIGFTIFIIASGFQINEHGARSMSLGGAYIGLANTPIATYLNPAGITQFSGTRLSIGTTLIQPNSKFTGPVGPLSRESELEKRYFTPINLYFTKQISDELFFGFAINNPYGLGTEWKEDWVGRYSTVKTEIRTFNFTPVIAYKFSEEFSASVGFSISYADVLINRKLQGVLPDPRQAGKYLMFQDTDLNMEGNNLSYGFVAGVIYKPSEKFSIGASFRSGIKYNFEGQADLTFASSTDAFTQQVAKVAFPNGNIKAPLTVPYVATIGIAYKPIDNLTLLSDFQYNGWKSYDKLEITFDDWKHPITQKNVITSKRDFENNYIIRFGAEYNVSNDLDLRAGLFFDKNPVKDEKLDPTLPDADRIGYNIGFGYKFTDNFAIDLAYLFLQFKERTINNSQEFIPIAPTPVALNGNYKSSAHLFAINLNYNF